MTDFKTDIMVLKEFFGTREGETLTQFVAEMRELGEDDKAILAEGIRNGTYTY